MARIFISYRRDDSADLVRWLFHLLSRHLGQDHVVFMDIDTIEPGRDFRRDIQGDVEPYDIIIAVIGRQWLTATNTEGQRRLDDPEDFVRMEIATALDRNISVIPVIVDGASMPRPAELPDVLQPIVKHQALKVHNPLYTAEVEHLIRVIEEVLGVNPSLPSGPAIYRTPRGKFDAAPSRTRDPVDCTAFAPQKVTLGQQALIQVFVHISGQTENLEALAEAADPETRRRGATALSTEIARGSQLRFGLNIPRIRIDEPVQEIIWNGTTASVQFSIVPPKSLISTLVAALRPVPMVATISVSQDNVAIGQIKFVLQIERTASEPREPKPTGQATRYQTAFISYASQNRPEVLRCMQILRLVGIDYFQDLLSLDPGQRWAQQLYHHIDSSDVLFLFWSTPAKKSKWVTKEWRYGLKQKGLGFIKPVIIEGPPPAVPPRALKKLHFNDWLQYVIRAEEAGRSETTEGHH